MDIITIQIIIAVIGSCSALITGYFGLKIKAWKAESDKSRQIQMQEEAAIKEGVLSLTRDKIIEIHDKYKERGERPLFITENMEKLYKSYKNLGGNGAIESLYIDFMKLPPK